MVDRVAQDRNETEDYSMKNEMENGQEWLQINRLR